MDVRRVVITQGGEGARVFMRQFAAGGGAASPLEKFLLALRLGLLAVVGVVILVPLVAIGVVLLLVAVVIGGAAVLWGRLKMGLRSLKRADGEGRQNVRVRRGDEVNETGSRE